MREVICHEIVHAFMYSYDIDLPNDIEEIAAEFFGIYGEDIMNSTALAYHHFSL